MKANMNIDVHHLARVEGHGNIKIRVKEGKIEEAKWEVVETPRFFEAMLKGMYHDMAPTLTSRICGICSIGHTLASLRAVENALEIEIPGAARGLRLLAKHGETLQSHVLHLFFLVAPDFFNVGSVLPLVKSHPDIINLALRLKGIANDMCDVIAGRTTHPTSLIVGGVSKVPEKEQLAAVKSDLESCVPDLNKTVELFKSLEIPDFVRETEFVSLKGKDNYPWIGGELVSTDGVVNPEDGYLSMTNEYFVDFSTSKFTKLSRDSFAVGALARFNNNFEFLTSGAKTAAKELGLSPVNHNPFMNNVAQLVECFHAAEESIEMIDKFLDADPGNALVEYDVKAGEGVGAVEVPRGILYHHYGIDEKGLITKADCVIPTTQNHANIHLDLHDLAEQFLKEGKNDKEITKLCEMLVRSYDPCISCSVH